MRDQLIGISRLRVAAKVFWRTDDNHRDVRADWHCDHVLCDLFAQANAGIEVIGDNIRETVVDNDLYRNVAV